jgi:hypothetical protein
MSNIIEEEVIVLTSQQESAVAEITASREIAVIMDKSGSMESDDTATGITRNQDAIKYTKGILKLLLKLDNDGIDAGTFGVTSTYNKDVSSVEELTNIFAVPCSGGTHLTGALSEAFKTHLERKTSGEYAKEGKEGTTLLVILDGAITKEDMTTASKLIIDLTNSMASPAEYRIRFIGIGTDEGIKTSLRELDDNLVAQGAKYDIVDSMTIEEARTAGIDKVLSEVEVN